MVGIGLAEDNFGFARGRLPVHEGIAPGVGDLPRGPPHRGAPQAVFAGFLDNLHVAGGERENSDLAVDSADDDPFDRMLIAQAQTEGLTLVSVDRTVARYDVTVLGVET